MLSKKRARVDLSIADKVSIINYSDDNPSLTHEEIAHYVFQPEKSISRSTVSKILSNKVKILEKFRENSCAGTNKRDRKGNFAFIDKAVWLWLLSAKEKKLIVSESLLSKKALEFKEKFLSEIKDDDNKENLKGFKASNGWVERFCKRFSIKSEVLKGESDPISQEKQDQARQKLKMITSQYLDEDVFNADETGLYYRMAPDRAVIAANDFSDGVEGDKERVSILLMTNSTGTYKSRLMVVGQVKAPRCLRGLNIGNLPADYRSNKNAWMSSEIFKEFLLDFDAKMREQHRNVLLLIDHYSAHSAALRQIRLSNVTIHFIASNFTSVLQPCESGIIKSFKAEYRKLFLLKAEKSFNKGKLFKMNIKNAINMSSKAWDSVSLATVCSSWNKVDILSRPAHHIKEEPEENESSCLMELSCLLAKSQFDQTLDPEEYLNVEERDELKISDEEIVKRILCENDIDDKDNIDDKDDIDDKDHKEDKDDNESQEIDQSENFDQSQIISIGDGINYLKQSLRFLQQQAIAKENDFRLLRRFITEAKKMR